MDLGSVRILLALGAALIALSASGNDAQAQTSGVQDDVVFTDYSPLSGNAELARRLLSPLAGEKIRLILERSGKTLSEQPIDLSAEKFFVRLPSRKPSQGYGLLVFVPPWREAKLPPGWSSVLDRYGVIFVSAERSGNDTDDLARREPLALLAAENIIRRHAVDQTRVYIAGFSGGSRVAMRLALGYPDLFRGALLNAGSDPIGDGQAPLPPRDLFLQFQSTTRLIYVTGELDTGGLAMDANSIHSMRAWCVFDVHAEVMPRVGHATPDSTSLARSLDALLDHARPDANRLAACRQAMENKLTAELQRDESLIAGGRRDDAHRLLIEIDRRFGGLAAPRSIDLSHQLIGPHS